MISSAKLIGRSLEEAPVDSVTHRFLGRLSNLFSLEMYSFFGLSHPPATPEIRLSNERSHIYFSRIYVNTHQGETDRQVRIRKMGHDLGHEMGHCLHDVAQGGYNFSPLEIQEIVAEFALVRFLDLQGGLQAYRELEGGAGPSALVGVVNSLFESRQEVLAPLALAQDYREAFSAISNAGADSEFINYFNSCGLCCNFDQFREMGFI